MARRDRSRFCFVPAVLSTNVSRNFELKADSLLTSSRSVRSSNKSLKTLPSFVPSPSRSFSVDTTFLGNQSGVGNSSFLPSNRAKLSVRSTDDSIVDYRKSGPVEVEARWGLGPYTGGWGNMADAVEEEDLAMRRHDLRVRQSELDMTEEVYDIERYHHGPYRFPRVMGSHWRGYGGGYGMGYPYGGYGYYGGGYGGGWGGYGGYGMMGGGWGGYGGYGLGGWGGYGWGGLGMGGWGGYGMGGWGGWGGMGWGRGTWGQLARYDSLWRRRRWDDWYYW